MQRQTRPRMSPSDFMRIQITFRSPPREAAASSGPTLHERTLEAVPRPKAQQIATDFVSYRQAPQETDRSKLYRYETNGDEVMVALDFKEVVALTAADQSLTVTDQ